MLELLEVSFATNNSCYLLTRISLLSPPLVCTFFVLSLNQHIVRQLEFCLTDLILVDVNLNRLVIKNGIPLHNYKINTLNINSSNFRTARFGNI